MNSLKNLLTLISAAIFGVMTVIELFSKNSGFMSPGFIISALMLIMMLVCRFFLVTKYDENNRETMKAATDILKNIKLPLGFIGGLTLPLAAIFAVCTLLTAISSLVTMPTIFVSIISAASYITIALLPLAFSMGLLNGKYGNGIDFMIYTIGLMIYIVSKYIDGAINPFVCSQLILSVSLWDMTSGLMRKEPPKPKAPKEKKPKKAKDNNEAKTEDEKSKTDIKQEDSSK